MKRLDLKERLIVIGLLPSATLFLVSFYYILSHQNQNTLEFFLFCTTGFLSVVFISLYYLLTQKIIKNSKYLELALKKALNEEVQGVKEIDFSTTDGMQQATWLLEEMLVQIKKERNFAQEANEAKSIFLANMSHEIRTPLNGIVGFTELLKNSGLKDEQMEFVQVIEKSSENLLEIINNILDLSKIENKKIEIENIEFDPIVEFESAAEVYAVKASEKDIDFSCFVDPNLQNSIKGDPTKIKEVILNLLSNAIKFTNSGGFVNINITKTESKKDGFISIKFEVQDNGIGVNSEQKQKIFEAFSQADASITRKYGGTGLGLTISSRFIELMGSKLELESQNSKGTTFFFTLEFEEIRGEEKAKNQIFSAKSALLFSESKKIKKQNELLPLYLNYLGVEFDIFKDMKLYKTLQNEKRYDFLFIDCDAISQDSLEQISKLSDKFILLTKSTHLGKIQEHGLNPYKVLYEPINFSKLKLAMQGCISDAEVEIPTKREPDLAVLKFNADILVAEDNTINQKIIKRVLEDLGLSVTLANNGLEAFQKRKDGSFELVFMDIQMPLLDGVEATQEILKWESEFNQKHVPIVALTANALNGDRERFLDAGLDEYISKPISHHKIISALNLFLSHKVLNV